MGMGSGEGLLNIFDSDAMNDSTPPLSYYDLYSSASSTLKASFSITDG